MSIDDEQSTRDQENVRRAYQSANAIAPGDMPSSVIDDAIRGAARRAVHAGPAPIGKSWVRRWTPQIAVAATVVLTVSVVFVAIDERPDLVPARVATMADAAKNVPLETKVVAELAAPQSAATNTPVLQSPLAVPTIPATEAQMTGATDSLRSTAEAAFEKKKNRADANVSPAPPPPAKLEARRERAADEAMAGNTPIATPVYAPPAAPAVAPPAQAVAKSVAEAPASAAKEAKIAEVTANTPQIAATKPAGESDSGATTSARQSSQAGAIATTAPAAATPSTANASPISPQAARAPSAANVATSALPLAPRITVGLRGSGDLDEKKAKVADKRDEKSTDAWIKRMTELKAQGKLKELRDEIARFKKRYPDRVLPKELAELPAE